jgi:hypothetical protein
MSKPLQQLDTGSQTTSRKAGVADTDVLLNANTALLLGLLLIIIPTLTGVALIA